MYSDTNFSILQNTNKVSVYCTWTVSKYSLDWKNAFHDINITTQYNASQYFAFRIVVVLKKQHA